MTNRIFKVSIIAAAVSAALGVSATASAVPGIKFSPNGTAGGQVEAQKFQWDIEQFMIQGGNAAVTEADFAANCPGSSGAGPICSLTYSAAGFFYGQGRLSTITNSTSATVLSGASANAISYEFKIPVSVSYTLTYNSAGGAFIGSQVSGSITNSSAAAALRFGAENYFRIFYNADGDETNQTAGTGYGTSNLQVNASQTLIFEGKVNVQGNGANNLDYQTVTPYAPIGTTGTTTQAGTPIFSASGGGSATLQIEHCDQGDATGPGAGNPEAACVNGTTTINTNFFRSDVDALTFDVSMIPGYQALFGDTPVPARVMQQLPNFGFDGTNWTNNSSCDLSAPTVGTDVSGATFQGCDMLLRGTNSNAQFNGQFAPEPGSLALLGLGLSALGFSVRRRRNKV